jgi:hypothetical protein
MPFRPMTRREVFELGATASATTLAVSAPSAFAASEGRSDPLDLIVGTVESVSSPQAALVATRDRGTVNVVLSADALVSRGGLNASPDLHEFRPGDQVVARGHSSGATFAASEFQTMYREMTGEVVEDRGDGLVDTSAGPLRIPPGVRARDGVGALPRGRSFAAEVWLDPDGSVPVAAKFSVGG